MNQPKLFFFMAVQDSIAALPSKICTTEDFVTSIFASAERSETVLSFTVMTMPTMPLDVTTLSPDLSASSNCACFLRCWLCGRIIRKYMTTKIKTIGNNSPKGEPCCAAGVPDDAAAGAVACAKTRISFKCII
jgi:hypothetical protein